MITKELIDSAYTYISYRTMVDERFANGETTGPIQSEYLLNYTKLNIQRMHRLDKTFDVAPEVNSRLQALTCDIYWLVLAEAWCGDAAQNLPILHKMAESSHHIHLRVLLRDEHLDIMDSFLTNGARAIPKLILLDGDMNVKAIWGPRPSVPQQMVMDNKRTGAMTYEELSPMLHKWYAENKGADLQKEMIQLLETSGCLPSVTQGEYVG
jgi:hypothetical protein